MTLKCNLKSKKQSIYYRILIPFFISMSAISHAQSHQDTQATLGMRPNTIKAIGVLEKINSQCAKLKIIQIVAQGSAIVNALSVGDEIVVKINKDHKKLLNFKVDVYLKEELGTDASQSKYVLIDASLNSK